MAQKRRIGFVSTRLAGTDGVSLEAAKWANIFNLLGHDCFYFAGELDYPDELSYTVPEAHFLHPEIIQLNQDLFNDFVRSPETSFKVNQLKNYFKPHLHKFIKRFEPDLLVAENLLSLPLNVPLGLALTEVIVETNIPTIGHHHDFYWERDRYALSGADDYLRSAFPPTVRQLHHVVINSFSQRQLALRTGTGATMIPNVMDFESPPPKPMNPPEALRGEIGISLNSYILLQPTRIIPRKRIERSIEFARRIELNCVLVISHYSGDEGSEYEKYLKELAQLLNVNVIFAGNRFAPQRSKTPDGKEIYALRDAYGLADLVTYPSRVEGFGNAFLESVYYGRPMLMSTYEIFKTDIQPKGFKVIGFGDFIDSNCIEEARKILLDPVSAKQMTDLNYEIARRHYSFRMLESQLASLLRGCLGID